MPCVSLQVKGIYIGEGGAGVVQATMATIDIYLVVVVGRSHVGSRRRSTNRGSIIRVCVDIALDSLPVHFISLGIRHLQEPAVVEAYGGACVTSKDEDFLLWGQDSGMLRTGYGHLISLRHLFVPMSLGC